MAVTSGIDDLLPGLSACANKIGKRAYQNLNGGFDWDSWREVAASGILSFLVEGEEAGNRRAFTRSVEAVRYLARSVDDEGLVFSLCASITTCIMPILKYGNQEQKTRLLPALSKGEIIGGNATSELGSGSDLSAMTTRATKANQAYIIDGVKSYVTNGTIAEVLIVYARHYDAPPFANVTAFLVEHLSDNSVHRRDLQTSGLENCPLTEVRFTDHTLPPTAVLGREQRGMAIFSQSMIWERLMMSAYHLGSMERQFNQTLRYARTREQFGKPISGYQYIEDKLVQMKVSIEAVSALLSHACNEYDNSQLTEGGSSIIKLVASESKLQNSLSAAAIHGARGFLVGCPIERQVRDSLAARTYSGTSEMQKRLIAEEFEEY